ncbi:hypothetical protein GGQ74_002420 [Desulfobaculum xiamenense]|uniref:Carboxypeptidase regulatory-like domain-containing protein n=1 Tax=Desulfobaculum xiamenense TaxID=995050 RepID=A0A846QNI1_9BACT|nr:hypothetical protein [Desulfobaculum xiamenense]NJB68747.1 hypothetical protein [Desulfobaculum xiamenense]
MIIMRKTLLLTLCLVIAMALTGCGSSGDSDSSGGTISGGAGGSIFAGSTVTVLDPAQSNKPIGTGITSDKGVFSVSGVPFGGPYIVKLTDGEEVVSGVGTLVTTPIFAIVPDVNGKEACQITPLSQFAYWVARGHAGADAIDLEDVNYALAYVKGATGVDVLNDSPVVGDDSSNANLTKVAKTRAAIKQFEAAVGYAPASPAFTQRVAVLGFDAADGSVDGSFSGDYGQALEEAGALDATELGKAETDMAATGTAFRTKMDELGSPAFKDIVKNVLDEVVNESGRALNADEKQAIADDAGKEIPVIDQNPVVGLTSNFVSKLTFDVNDTWPGTGSFTFLVYLKRADGTLEALTQDAAVTCTFDGAQKAAFSFGYAVPALAHEIAITPPEGGFQVGEVMATLSYTVDGRDLTTSFRFAFVSDGSALREIALGGELWRDSFKGGLEFGSKVGDFNLFDPFTMDFMAQTVSGTGISPDAKRNLVLTIDKGELRFAGEGEGNWATSHIVEYDGVSFRDKGFEYRIAGNWAVDTTVTMTLADSKDPDVKDVRTFKLWERRSDLKSVTFGKETDSMTFEVGDPEVKHLSVSVVAKLCDGTVLDMAQAASWSPFLAANAKHGTAANAAFGEADGKLLLTFDYTAPSETDWAAVTDNEADAVTVQYGTASNFRTKDIILDLVDDVK